MEVNIDELILNKLDGIEKAIKESRDALYQHAIEEMRERTRMQAEIDLLMEGREKTAKELKSLNDTVKRWIWVLSGAVAVLIFLDLPGKLKTLITG